MSALRADVPIQLGLLSIHVDIETAVQAEVSFSNVCDEGHPAMKAKAPLKCPHVFPGDKPCPNTTFKKGREVGGQLVILTAEEVAGTAVDESLKKAMAITVHSREEVATRSLPSAAAYFLTEGKSALPGVYGLLHHLIRTNPDKAMVTIFAAKGKPAEYRFDTFGDIITLQKLAWPGDLKALPVVPLDFEEAYLAMAQQLVDTLTVPFEPEKYVDTQRVAREALVASKMDEAVPYQALPANLPANVSTGLLAALQASLSAAGATPAVSKPAKKAASHKKVSA